MSMFAGKNVINVCKKSIVFDIKNMQVKNLFKSVTKYN